MYAIGTVTGGLGDEAHYKALEAIVDLAEASGWTRQRYVSSGAVQEWIGKAEGLSTTEEIYVGFRTYQDQTADYYNLLAGTFTGYVSGNSFDTQPNAKFSGIPAHNNAITYFITANEQRIVVALKVGTPVYTSGYVGKLFPYARPSEFPSPLVCAGMLTAAAAVRYSNIDYRFPWEGFALGNVFNNMFLRTLNGLWVKQNVWPFSNGQSDVNVLAGIGTGGRRVLYPLNDTIYQIEPLVLHESYGLGGSVPVNVWGELDGVYFISGFNNGVENVLQIGGTPVDQTGLSILDAVDDIIAAGGRAFVVIQNVSRTGFRDYIALEMK